MTCTSLTHGCKINYSLAIGPRRVDGYHEIDSIFLPLAIPADRLDIRPGASGSGLSVRFVRDDSERQPVQEIDARDNSLVRAYEEFARASGFIPDLAITVVKRIPVGGGLGGGSANAAALLKFLRDAAVRAGARPLPWNAFVKAGKAVGADVPFFLHDKPARVTGIGEKLSFIDNPVAGMHLVLVRPDIAISTAWAYAELDRIRGLGNGLAARKKKDCGNSGNQPLTMQLHQANYSSPAGRPEYGNDFEKVVFDRYPDLSRLKQSLLDSGARIARLSGTGACIFALYSSGAQARDVTERLANQGFMMYSQRM